MKVLIVDDHTLVRKGIATVLQQRFPDASAAVLQRIDAADLDHLKTAVGQILSVSTPEELSL